jgi:hypothetical protein
MDEREHSRGVEGSFGSGSQATFSKQSSTRDLDFGTLEPRHRSSATASSWRSSMSRRPVRCRSNSSPGTRFSACRTSAEMSSRPCLLRGWSLCSTDRTRCRPQGASKTGAIETAAVRPGDQVVDLATAPEQ